MGGLKISREPLFWPKGHELMGPFLEIVDFLKVIQKG